MGQSLIKKKSNVIATKRNSFFLNNKRLTNNMITVVVVEIHQVIRKNPKAALSLLDSFFLLNFFYMNQQVASIKLHFLQYR